MEKLSEKKAKRIVITVIILITVLLGILEFALLQDYSSAKKNHNDIIINYYEKHYDAAIYDYRMMARIYFDEILNKDNILTIMKEANGATDDRKNELRNELYGILKGTYLNAVKNNFRQVHFALNDGESFLRMHKVDKYGDDLTKYRDSVRIVNDEKRFVEGFEEGKIFNGYRFEFPLFKDDEYIGCVETSISFVAITELMNDLFEDKGMFIIKKSVAEESLWEEFIEENYLESEIIDNYYCDKEVLEYVKDKELYIDIFENPLAVKEIKEKILELLKEGETFLINIKSGNREYKITFLKIENVVGEHNGYLIFYGVDENIDELKKNIIIKSMSLLMLWLALIMTILSYHSSRIKINKLLYFDKLTGAYGRNKFDELIQQELERSKRYSLDLSIILFDIDKFKNINDTYGHGIGDILLKETAALVMDNIRINDYLFRIGGDEFLIILPNTELEDAASVAEKLRKIAENNEYADIKIKNITFSMGVAQYNKDESGDEFLTRADIIMYKAKETGRNKVVSEWNKYIHASVPGTNKNRKNCADASYE